MNAFRKRLLLGFSLGILAIFFFLWPQLSSMLLGTQPSTANAQGQLCTVLGKPSDLPSPVLINFDSLPDGKPIGTSYKPSFGVSFEDSAASQVFINGNPPTLPHSKPNVAENKDSTAGSAPLIFTFDTPKTHVGFYIGGGTGDSTADVKVLDANGRCALRG